MQSTLCLVQLEDVAFRYRGAISPVLREVNLKVNKGDRILITGRSGSGKSTLLLILAGLAPEYSAGKLTGKRSVFYTRKGIVLQNPEAQIVTPTVREEIAFSLENQGQDPKTVLKKVDAVMEALGISHLANRHPLTLSGGECQRVSLAAALVLSPEILFLDEPTSYLDDASSNRFFDALSLLPPETAVLVVEHRLDLAVRFCKKALRVNKEGTVVPTEVPVVSCVESITNRFNQDGIQESSPRLSDQRDPILEIRKLYHCWLEKPKKLIRKGNPNARLKDRNPEHGYLLKGIHLTVVTGEIVAILGPSGSGKTTLLNKINGIHPVDKGTVYLGGRDITTLSKEQWYSFFMYVPQNPEHMFLAETVQAELEYQGNERNSAKEVAERFGLRDKLKVHPFRLSEGEKRRLTLSIAFASPRALYLLDEPTYGLDTEAKVLLKKDLLALAERGSAVVFVTHDQVFAKEVANTVYVLQEGHLIQEGTSEPVDIGELVGTPT
ncbi:MAG: ATP-binding cassette domain-containing protein [Spirochaetales bacterium]